MCTYRFDPKRALSLSVGLILGAILLSTDREAHPSSSPEVTTTITSERMTVQNKERRAVFEGKVVLTKGDLVVRSDVMVVFYRPQQEPRETAAANEVTSDGLSQGAQLSVHRIEATGHVKIEKAAGRATCRRAVYYQNEQKIVLTGAPVAWQRGNRVTGRQITMFLDQDRTVVEGGSKVLLENVEPSEP